MGNLVKTYTEPIDTNKYDNIKRNPPARRAKQPEVFNASPPPIDEIIFDSNAIEGETPDKRLQIRKSTVNHKNKCYIFILKTTMMYV